MRKKRPLAIKLLILFFSVGLITDVGYFLGESQVMYHFFVSLGFGPLLTILVALFTVADALALKYLWRPKPIGYSIAIFSILISIISLLIVYPIFIYHASELTKLYEVYTPEATTIGKNVAAWNIFCGILFIPEIIIEIVFLITLISQKNYFLKAKE